MNRTSARPFLLLISILLMLMAVPEAVLTLAQDQVETPTLTLDETQPTPEPTPDETPAELPPADPVEAPTTTPEPDLTEEAPVLTLEPTPPGTDIIDLPPAPTPDAEAPVTPAPVATDTFYDDFELGLAKWSAAPGITVMPDADGNQVAVLTGGAVMQPLGLIDLGAYELALWFNLTAGGSLAVTLPGELTLNLSGAEFSLTDNTGLALATGSPDPEADFWSMLEVVSDGESLVIMVDGESAIRYSHVTTFVAAQFSLRGDGVMVDDVSIAALSDDLPIDETPEPTPTETPTGPVTLDMDASKIDGALLNVLDVYQTGNLDAAFGLADSLRLERDKRARISVVIWAAEGVDPHMVAGAVTAAGGRVEIVDTRNVYARVSLESIAALSLSDAVSVILVAERLASTGEFAVHAPPPNHATGLDGVAGPIGREGTEGFNVIGAESWHFAGLTGQIGGERIPVAIIDIGFGGGGNATNDLTCLDTYPQVGLAFGTIQAGDTRRGLDMAEILCDIAPNARVRLYKATNTPSLANAINQAALTSRVILMGVDLGVNAAPGDGTLGYFSSLDPYFAITRARQDGVIVIASAGNNGQSHRAFRYNGGTVTLTVRAGRGDFVNLGWNDWDDVPNGGAPREDISATLSGAGISTLTKPARGSSNPGHQFTVPTNCPVDGQGLCTLTLTLNGLTGSQSLVQVQATGLRSTVGAPSGGTPLPDAGSIARPGDSPDVITVGAVCADYNSNFPTLPYTSRGPVYTPGGNFTALPATPFKGNEVKPDVVGPSQVSVRTAVAGVLSDCDQGFGGSEAAAAHVAGMATLLINNQNVASFRGSGAQEAIRRYLRTHSIDLHTGPTADGYDMTFGAGLTTLGSPTFNPDTLPAPQTFITPNRLPDSETCNPATAIYVGPYEVGSSAMNGSLAAPFTHPAQAIAVATAGIDRRCVILLPGEYVSPLLINVPGKSVGIYGYSSVVRVAAPPTRMHVTNGYVVSQGNFLKQAGIYVQDMSNVAVGGITFTVGQIAADINIRTPFPRASVYVADTAPGAIFTNNRINNAVDASATLVQVVRGSAGAAISNNIFRNNRFTGNLLGASLIAVDDAGTAGAPVQVIANTMRDNLSVRGLWTLNGLPTGQTNFPIINWVPLVRSVDSFTDITNNTIRENQSETLIQIVTRGKGQNFIEGGPDNAPQVARIMGNAIVGNVMRTEDFVLVDGQQIGLNSGPVIHLWHAQKTYIVNNTIAANRFTQTSVRRLIILRGNDSTDNPNEVANDGSLGSRFARWEIVNNFVYANGTYEGTALVNGTQGLVDDVKLTGVGCTALLGTLPANENRGARHNWVYNGRIGGTGESLPGGVCSTSILTGANNNIFALDPWARDEEGATLPGNAQFIVGGEDIFAPGFYALQGVPSQATQDGVDEGDNAYVLTNMPTFYNGLDVRGVQRVQYGGQTSGPAIIDIGAYERSPLIVQDPIEITGAEDSGALGFDFETYISGGAPPYDFEILRYPTIFGTQCGPGYTFANRGVQILTLDSGITVASYCPPPDFHTSYAGFNQDDVSFQVRVRDTTRTAVTTNVNFTVTPVNDTILTTVLTTQASVGLGRTADVNRVRLRPFVSFSNNFVFSERNNPTGTANREVDYDFTYQGGGANPPLPTLVVGDPVNVNPEVITTGGRLSWINAQRGILGVNLTGVNTQATAKLQYTVRDARGGEVTNFIIVKAVQVPSAFNLLRPVDGTTLADVEALSAFAWQVATPAQTYTFILEREVDTNFYEPVVTLEGLTPGSGDDALVCNATECSLSINLSLLAQITPGRYRWNVLANNEGLEREANAPFTFRLLTGRELLRNGGFEIAGATQAQAQFWNPGPNNRQDRRRCNNDANPNLAFEQQCVFQFRAQQNFVGSIAQPIRNHGARAGDTLTLSVYAESVNLQAQTFILARVTYNNNTRQNIRLVFERGTTNGYRRYTGSVQLTRAVKDLRVRIVQQRGTGRVNVDLASLILEPRLEFNLLGPANGSLFVEQSRLDNFTWQESGTARRYDFRLINRDTQAVVLDLPGLTGAKDNDRLNCGANICRLTLENPLPSGRYEWTVTASNGITASNAPFRFEVDTAPQELLLNGGMEQRRPNNPPVPLNWTVNNRGNDRILCNAYRPNNPNNPDNIRSHQQNCAFVFEGQRNVQVRMEQVVANPSIVQPDDLLTLSFFAQSLGLQTGRGYVVVNITYTDNTTDNMRIDLLPGRTPYLYYTQSKVIEKPVRSLRVRAFHTFRQGGFRIDNISLTRRGPG